ncbi:MAG: hypothetical protein AABX96_04385 [Nanoarchaeota archaeon]
MDGHKLERVDDEGTYRCKLVYGSNGGLSIRGIEGSYQTFWEKLPPIPNRNLTSKMVGECIAAIREAHSKTGKPPLTIISTSSDFCARRSDSLLEQLDGKMCPVYTIAETGESEIEYLLKMTPAQKQSNGVLINGINYGMLWEQLPAHHDEDKRLEILQKASRTGEIFTERYKFAPSVIVASLKRGSRLVRSRAE